jgi:hypothetical protein
MRDTNPLQLALGLTPPWTVTRRLRPRGTAAGHRDRRRPKQLLRLSELWRGGLPGIRHDANELAPTQLFRAPIHISTRRLAIPSGGHNRW